MAYYLCGDCGKQSDKVATVKEARLLLARHQQWFCRPNPNGKKSKIKKD